jgi:hypothetical protein
MTGLVKMLILIVAIIFAIHIPNQTGLIYLTQG